MNSIHRFFSVSLLVFSVAIAGCTSAPKPEGKPLPQLTFSHVRPLMLNVASLNVENRYRPGEDLRDVSESFPMPPDMALMQYTQQRLRPSPAITDNSALNVIIEDMHVYQREEKPQGMNGWLGLNDSDHYDIAMTVRMFAQTSYGAESPQATLHFTGDLKIPERYSIAEREAVQMKFLEELMLDVDEAYVRTLRDTLHVLRSDAPITPYSVYTAPDVDFNAIDIPEARDDYNNEATLAPESLAPPEMR
jgi:hypothetical protein